jgi:hypothetical protein
MIAAAVLLSSVSASPVVITLPPDAQYTVQATASFCAGLNCDTPYNNSLIASVPTTLQVGCSAAAGAPNCGGASLNVVPSPYLSVAAMTSLNHPDQVSASGHINVTYYYEVLCSTCSPGTVVPLSIGGFMEAHYIPGTLPPNGTLSITDLDRIFVNGYNPLTAKDNVWVDVAMEGLGASTGTQAAPMGFGLCESTWNGYDNCTGGPSGPFGTPFYAIANEPYSIFLAADAAVGAINQPFATDYAEATMDPVISFGAGFDSTGYSIALSAGVGNEASTVPEPATWRLLSIAVLAWVGHRLPRMMKRGI